MYGFNDYLCNCLDSIPGHAPRQQKNTIDWKPDCVFNSSLE